MERVGDLRPIVEIGMTSTIIVWDLETVPDLPRFAAANGLVDKTDAEIREALGDKFPKHIYYSIICIGALIAQRDQAHWVVKALGVPNVGGSNRKAAYSSRCRSNC
jgi:hypothetical protein